MSACCGTKQVTTNLAPPDPTKHVNYVRGMVLEVDEFTQEFAYLSGRDRWLAREAIGYGTLRGLALSWAQDTTGKILPQVMLTSGVALTPCGQLVCISSNQCADINQWLAARTNEISSGLAAAATSGALTLYVTLAYSDCPTDDAPVPGEPCRSAAELMQPSRITDSFQLELSYDYDAPLQEEEEAVRGFAAWLRKIPIDPLPNKSVATEVFVAAVRAWSTSASDPASLTISAADVSAYHATALRLWVTELRVAAAAFQRFKLWLYSVPHKTDGTATEAAFLAEVRRWTPSACSWPGNLVVKTADGEAFIKDALALWDTEIAPKWHTEFCGCGAPPCIESCDDRLLLGRLDFKVVKNAGNSWMVDSSTSAPTVDESRRPILGHLRALQEQMIPSPESGSAVLPSFAAPLHVAPYRHVAMGRLTPGLSQTTPVFGNLRVSDVKSGEVYFTFDDYSKPDSEHDYVVQAIASYHTSTTSRSQPAVRFAGFNDEGFMYKVTRSNTAVPKAELEAMEFQVEVSIIVKPN